MSRYEYISYILRRSELVTTDTEEKAMARLAAQGGRLIMPRGSRGIFRVGWKIIWRLHLG